MIKIPNVALTLENEQKLSPDELMMFVWLFKYHNPDNDFVSSVDLLSSMFKFKKGNDRENKPYIRNLLASLEMKKYIDSTITEFSSYNGVIHGKIKNPDENYSGVDSLIVDEFLKENIYIAKLKLYIYADVNRYKQGNTLSYSTISQKCNYFGSIKHHSISTVQKIINEMDGKLIYRFSGERIEDSPEQETNTYFSSKYITESLKLLYIKQLETKEVKKSRIRKDHEFVKFHGFYGDELTIGNLKQHIKESNWNKRDSLTSMFLSLSYDDYILYRLAKDERIAPTFVHNCEKAMKKLDEKYEFEEWEKKYLEHTNMEEFEAKTEEKNDIQYSSDFEGIDGVSRYNFEDENNSCLKFIDEVAT